jgi:hypothetical protein
VYGGGAGEEKEENCEIEKQDLTQAWFVQTTGLTAHT